MRLILPLFLFFVSSSSAHAHLGHLGELAGHSHWIALGAGAAAAVIAAALGKRKLDKEKEAADEEIDEQPEAETAGA